MLGDQMKKSNYIYRLLVLVLGVILIALGATIIVTSDIGGDSVVVLQQGFTDFFGIEDLGLGILILNTLLIFVLYLMNKKMVNIGTFITSLLIGPLVSLYSLLPFLNQPDTLILQILMTIAGSVITSIGIAVYIIANIGYSPYEGIMITIKDKTKIRFSIVKIIGDVVMFGIGILLGGKFGIGSIIAIILFGPLIELFLKVLRPKFAFLDLKH
jgi:uncharacterized membrane protein YczE